jgi:hypothetical protein
MKFVMMLLVVAALSASGSGAAKVSDELSAPPTSRAVPLAKSSAPMLTTDKSLYTVIQAVSVTFSGATNATDWIGLYAQGTTPSSTSPSLAWMYVNGSQTAGAVVATGTVTFAPGTLTAAGSYKACVLQNGGYTVLATANFTVTAGTYPVIPFLSNPFTNSMTVGWHSSQTTNDKVIFGTSPAALTSTASAVSAMIGTNRWHHAKMTPLIPNTVYYYRCVSNTDSSDFCNFKTPALPSDKQFVRFVLLGDTRKYNSFQATNVNKNINNVLTQLYGNDWHLQFDAVMNVGDIIWEGGAADSYKPEFYDQYSVFSYKIPTMVAIGNHEYSNDGSASNFKSYMNYEEFAPNASEETYYSFQLGSALFVVFNSNLTSNSQQNTWLQNTFTAANTNSAIDFVFGFCHHPGHQESWNDDNSWVENSVIPWMTGCTKSAFLAYGHTHDYERGAVTTSNPHDIYLINSSGGGADDLSLWSFCNPGGSYNCTDWPEIHRTLICYNFQIVEIDVAAKTASITCYSMNQNAASAPFVLDKYHLRLNQAPPAQPTCAAYNLGASSPYLKTSAFSSPAGDSLMSSEFQCTLTQGNYSSPAVDVLRHWEDYYMNPSKTSSVNLNAGIDLTRLDLTPYTALNGKQFWFRARYRDMNLKWSVWSDQISATTTTIPGRLNLDIVLPPGPAINEATFSLTIPEQGYFNISILNINGQTVKPVYTGILKAGSRRFLWDGTDASGKRAASAYYFIRVWNGNKVFNRKIAFFNYK